MDVKTLFEKLQDAEGFMITASLIDSKGKIDHFLILDKYNIEDVNPSHEEIKKLINKTFKKKSK